MSSQGAIGREKAAPLLLMASGAVVMGIGLYFVFLRPALLPEDVRFIGGTMESIRSGLPGLASWLGKVFTVMGGYIFAAGLLTAYVALNLLRAPRPEGWLVALLAGLSSIGVMSAVNFVIDSDFKWPLFGVALLWASSLLLHVLSSFIRVSSKGN